MFVVERADFALFLMRSLVLGAILGGIYLMGGFFRIFLNERCSRKLSAFVLFLHDLCFCLLTAFLNILMIFSANRGQVRIVALLFETAGFAVVVRLCKTAVYRMQRQIMRFFKCRIFLPLTAPVKRCVLQIRCHINQKWERRIIKRYNKRLDRMLLSVIDRAVKTCEEALFQSNAVQTVEENRNTNKRRHKNSRRLR